MAYMDVTYYTETFKGFIVPSEKFDYYSERAYEEINSNINVEPLVDPDITDAIKNCNCAVMDKMYNLNNKQELSSESVGSYKRSFNTSKPQNSDNRNLYSILIKYLGKTGLLYRGVDNVY